MLTFKQNPYFFFFLKFVAFANIYKSMFLKILPHTLWMCWCESGVCSNIWVMQVHSSMLLEEQKFITALIAVSGTENILTRGIKK